jgi:hypothetical protein
LEQLVKLADAVKMLTAVEGDLALAARGIEVDQKELAAALAKANADSAEAVVMRMLVKAAQPEPAPPEE